MRRSGTRASSSRTCSTSTTSTSSRPGSASTETARSAPDFGLQTYPKVSASWVTSDEDFWPESFGTMKLRAAYGQSGRAPGAFDAVRTWNATGFATDPAFTPDNVGNPDLGPEVTAEWEVGFDARVARQPHRLHLHLLQPEDDGRAHERGADSVARLHQHPASERRHAGQHGHRGAAQRGDHRRRRVGCRPGCGCDHEQLEGPQPVPGRERSDHVYSRVQRARRSHHRGAADSGELRPARGRPERDRLAVLWADQRHLREQRRAGGDRAAATDPRGHSEPERPHAGQHQRHGARRVPWRQHDGGQPDLDQPFRPFAALLPVLPGPRQLDRAAVGRVEHLGGALLSDRWTTTTGWTRTTSSCAA